MKFKQLNWSGPLLTAVTVAFSVMAGFFTMNTSSAALTPDPFSLYGKSISFDVWRKGEKVGHHTVAFEKDGETLKVNSIFLLEIKLLFIVAYRFRYQSNEIWQKGRLTQLDSDVNDDGDKTVVKMSSEVSRMKIIGPEGTALAPGPLYATTHWNAGVIQQNRVLNTLTGHVNNVDIKPLNAEMIETENGPVSATRYAYTGDLDTEVWYDNAGRWVKMKFKGRDGSDIEYKCKTCQGGSAKNETTVE